MSATPRRGRLQRPAEPGLLGIIGRPVRASLSPAMQQAALRRLRLNACYQAFEIAPDQVPDVLRALAPLGFWDQCHDAQGQVLLVKSTRGRRIGAVNTVTSGAGGCLAPRMPKASDWPWNRGGPRSRARVYVGAGDAARAVASPASAPLPLVTVASRATGVQSRSAARCGFPGGEIGPPHRRTGGGRWSPPARSSSTPHLGGRPADLPVPVAGAEDRR
jgi:shikimate 5-dehydrogenase